MHSPSISDFTNLKRILWYVKGIVSMGISTLDDTGCTIRAYSDSKWTVCTTTRHYTLGFCTFLAKTWSRGCRKETNCIKKFLRGRVYAIVWNSIRIGLDKFASQEISESLFMLHPSSFETLSLLYTWRQTMHSIKESTTLKWIITMSVKEWP